MAAAQEPGARSSTRPSASGSGVDRDAMASSVGLGQSYPANSETGFFFMVGSKRETTLVDSHDFTRDAKSTRELLAGTSKVLAQAKLSSDVMNPLTLRFRDRTIEEVFQHENAVAHTRGVYAGYFLQLTLGSLGIFVSCLSIRLINASRCAELLTYTEEMLCHKLLGSKYISDSSKQLLMEENSTLSRAILEDTAEDKLDFGLDLINSTTVHVGGMAVDLDSQQVISQVFNIAWCALAVLVLTYVHWRIHLPVDGPQVDAKKFSLSRMTNQRGAAKFSPRKEPSKFSSKLRSLLRIKTEVKSKKLATLVAAVGYTVELCGFCILTLIVHSYDAFWQLRLLSWYAFVLMTGVWFTGMLFWQSLAMATVSMMVYCACTIPIIQRSLAGDLMLDDLSEVEPIFELVLYAGTTSILLVITILMVMSSYSNEMTERTSFLHKFMICYQQDKMLEEKKRRSSLQEQMLNRILPPAIVKELTSTRTRHDPTELLRTLSHRHESVSILFADVVGFSTFAKDVESLVVMEYLNKLFEGFDRLCDEHNAYKVETIGDCYVATVGLVTGRTLSENVSEASRIGTSNFNLSITESVSGTFRVKAARNRVETSVEAYDKDIVQHLKRLRSSTTMRCTSITDAELLGAARENTRDLTLFAKAMICQSKTVAMAIREGEEKPTSMRVGIHTGSCLSGIVGTRNLRFCVLGESVRVAQKLEESGKPDHLHASHVVRALVPGECWRPSNVTFGEKETYLLKPFVE